MLKLHNAINQEETNISAMCVLILLHRTHDTLKRVTYASFTYNTISKELFTFPIDTPNCSINKHKGGRGN